MGGEQLRRKLCRFCFALALFWSFGRCLLVRRLLKDLLLIVELLRELFFEKLATLVNFVSNTRVILVKLYIQLSDQNTLIVPWSSETTEIPL